MIKTISIIALLSLGTAFNSYAGNSDRIDQLENEVHELKLRVLELESFLSNPNADQEVRYLSPAEEKRLYKALDSRTGYFPVFVRLLVNTGIRPREAFTLEWSAVNFDLKQITVHAAFSKTDKTRHIPLNTTIFKIMQDWHTLVSDDSPHVFTNPLTEKRIVSVQKVWRNCLTDADIQEFRLYDLRHTFASKLAMAGVEIYRIAELLGHSSVEMSKVYAHLSPDYLAEAVNAIG